MASAPGSTSEYLTSKTEALQSQAPVSPSQARAAQIPVQTFNLPTFPPDAFSAGLSSLILTSDIKLDEYTSLLTLPFTVPDLPRSITSLTLELFSLGYPPGFLTELARKLPGLKSLTVYSQLLAGTTPDSRTDALKFVGLLLELQELHLLDVFAPMDFFADLGKTLTTNLKFLELNFTYRHSDPKFLNSLPGKEIAGLIRGQMVGLSISIGAPDVTEDEEDREGSEVGVRVFGRGVGELALKRIEESRDELRMLDLSMFELAVQEVRDLVGKCTKVKVLGVAVRLENGWEEFFDGACSNSSTVEVLELIGVPSVDLVEKMKEDVGIKVGKEQLEKLGRSWKDLKSVKISILRTTVELWLKEQGSWEKKA